MSPKTWRRDGPIQVLKVLLLGVDSYLREVRSQIVEAVTATANWLTFGTPVVGLQEPRCSLSWNLSRQS